MESSSVLHPRQRNKPSPDGSTKVQGGPSPPPHMGDGSLAELGTSPAWYWCFNCEVAYGPLQRLRRKDFTERRQFRAHATILLIAHTDTGLSYRRTWLRRARAFESDLNAEPRTL